MDMQNVKNLTIPEGDVKTIHDKDSRLLWGAVGYDTKYAGDTFQQTYSGKNLFNMNSTTITTSSASASVVNNKLRVSNGYAGSAHFVVFKIGDTQDYAGLSLTLKSNWITSGANTGRIYIGTSDSAGDNRTLLQSTTTSGESITAIIPTIITSSNNTLILVFYSNNNSAQVGDYVDYSQTQLEVGSAATTYEPYVGGTASPNPDYPQNIDVVTGEQTVTISDGTNSENFTIDLGNTELCKIGTYQDYIYKSGDDWYIHKACGKVTYDGNASENWVYNNSFSRVHIGLADNMRTYASNAYCTHLAIGDTATASSDNVFNIGGTTLFMKATSVATSKDAWMTWLTTHNVSLYYSLATPTDTKITNSTLIGELEAIHEWMTRYGYQASVSGNLPMIIRQDALT